MVMICVAPRALQSEPDPNPTAPGMVEGARSVGMPTFDSTNGRLMEGNSGATILERGGNNGCRANKPPHLLFWSVSCDYKELVPSVQKTTRVTKTMARISNITIPQNLS